MNTFFAKLKLVITDRTLRRRILFVIGALGIFRVLAVIPIPGVNPTELASFLQNNQFFGLLNLFSGGGLSNLSIVMLGVGPFITASIIMQLLTMIFPRLKELYQEEGEAGRRKFGQYSRFLSIPLAVIQGFGLLTLLKSQGVISSLSLNQMIMNVVVITAGSALLMWIGELINEFGIGNGVSLIIFGGIISRIPQDIAKALFTFIPSDIPIYLGFIAAALVIIGAVVVVTEAERPIPVTYAKRVRGMKMYGGISTYLPLRLNQNGTIPIIFALSILLFPQMIVNLLAAIKNPVVVSLTHTIQYVLKNLWIYGTLYAILVFLFTYFYTAVTFDPKQISDNLQKNGAFIPGVRPGQSTAFYISKVLTRITGFGALFLAVIAVLPIAMQGITGNAQLAIGGTGLLIVVSVVLDLVKQLNAQVSMREY